MSAPTSTSGGLVLFDPDQSSELLRGWQLHALRRRAIHELAARQSQRAAYWLSAAVTVFAAVAGSSAFVAAHDQHESTALGVAALGVGLAAAIAAPLQSTLDPGGRAERHRQAAVAYKGLLRTFERIAPEARAIPAPGGRGALAALLGDVEARLTEADAAAPVLPARLARRVEAQPVAVVADAVSITALSGLVDGDDPPRRTSPRT